ncbi:MAG TPA: hypothetical protein PLL10_04040 [Elusimicrobiales bacterium]|nr:hypothetical protein [Elusimicrobiales bacterium]
MKRANEIFLLFLLFPSCVFAAPAVPLPEIEINACDRSVIGAESKAKSGWTSASGLSWMVFNMDQGFAVCLYGDRYLVFPENMKALDSISVSSDTLSVRLSGQAGGKTDYFFRKLALWSVMEPYRGQGAVFVSPARITYSSDGKTPIRGHVAAERLDAGFNSWYGFVTGDNWLWSNAKVLRQLKAWVTARLAARKAAEREGCVAGVGLMLDIPRSRLPKYLEVTAHRKGKEPVAEIFRTPAAELVCEDMDGLRFRELLPEGEVLKVFK